MHCTTKNNEKNAILISRSDQQSLNTSNQEEAGTRMALLGSENSQLALVKAKDTDILNMAVYAFALTSPPCDWYL